MFSVLKLTQFKYFDIWIFAISFSSLPWTPPSCIRDCTHQYLDDPSLISGFDEFVMSGTRACGVADAGARHCWPHATE